MHVLEVGPDPALTYRALVSADPLVWETLDIGDSPDLTFPRSEPYRFPAPGDTYDIVLSGQVIEHVAQIWRWMREIARVTRPGGRVVTIAPCSWPMHEHPIDCWRIYPDGMRALYEDAGPDVELAVSEALEQPGTKVLPGRSREHQPQRLRRGYRLFRLARLPVEQAVDTIGIARKPTIPAPVSETLTGAGDAPA